MYQYRLYELLLKDKGFVFVTTINRTPASYALAIVAAEYILNLVPRGTHSWDKFVKPEELANLFDKSTLFYPLFVLILMLNQVI